MPWPALRGGTSAGTRALLRAEGDRPCGRVAVAPCHRCYRGTLWSHRLQWDQAADRLDTQEVAEGQGRRRHRSPTSGMMCPRPGAALPQERPSCRRAASRAGSLFGNALRDQAGPERG